MNDGTTVDDRARAGLEADLDGPRLGGVPAEIALVLERGKVRMHRGTRRQADGLADLAHAGRIALAANLGIDELEDLLLARGER